MKQDLSSLQSSISQLPVTTQPNGSRVIEQFLGPTDCVRYVGNDIVFQPGGKVIAAPEADEVVVSTIAVSLCGTDIDLIDKTHQGKLPPESQGKVVGHEGAGIIVGLGKDVTGWQIGQIVNFDSHFACGLNGHKTFHDCVMSGKSCDGIVGGIRGSMKADGTRNEPRDGYWSRVIVAPAGALSVEMPLHVAQQLVAPSTLESLGNIYMIIGQLEKANMLTAPQDTLFVVSGLGATGYPMAAVATHYGFQVIGINPSPSKRQFAEQAGVCQATFASTQEAQAYALQQIAAGKVKQVVVATMVGDETALEEALQLLEQEQIAALSRKVAIVFGLYHDAQKPMPMAPDAIPQRDFVFSRHSFTLPKGGEVYGVCGRDLHAWETLMKDLQPAAGSEMSKLAGMLNAAQHMVEAEDSLKGIAEILQGGSAQVKQVLKEHGKLKLVANLVS